jgi:ADP-ribose pyrophosphatase YjhB (NUDIX family)
MFIEPSLNVIVVPVYESKEIYLHEEYRPKVMKPDTSIRPYDFDSLKLKSLGMWSLEVPRGAFNLKDEDSKNAAIREVKEETTIKDLKRKDFLLVGNINPNTAYVVSNIPVYIAKCKSKKINPRLEPEEKEKIKAGKWYCIKEVKTMIREKKIFCAVTLAALNLILQKLKK